MGGASRDAVQRHRERRALSHGAFEIDSTAVRANDFARNPQSQPETAIIAGRHRTLEALENALLVGLRDSYSEITHGDDRVRADRAHHDMDGLAGTVLYRVQDQIENHTLEADAVPVSDDRL